MKKYKDIIHNTIIDDKKIYQNGKQISDFFKKPLNYGVAIIKNNKVLFAENYKTFKKATEAYETIVAMAEIFNLYDNETIITMWNWVGCFNSYCLLTEEVKKQSNNISNKWFKYYFEEITEEQRKKIKEIRFNKKNLELMSYAVCERKVFNDLCGYTVVIDNTVTEDFKVIYED